MDELIKHLGEIRNDVDFENCQELVTGGYLSSLDIIQIVAMIHSAFGVTVPVSKILPSNFNSAEKLWELIEDLRDD